MWRWAFLIAGLAWATCASAQKTSDFKLCAGDSGTVDERIAACTRAIKSGKLSNADLAATYYNRGIEWRNKRDNDRAIADYTEALRLDPKDASAYNNRGLIWRDKRDYDQAIADYGAAIRLRPKDASFYNNRGIAWRDKKDYDRAIADYTEAIRLKADYVFAYNNRGNAWSSKRDYDRAIADYNEAIRLNPKYATGYNNRGIAWRAKGEHDKALADYNEAIRLNPKYANAYNNRGNTWIDKRDRARALADYNEAIRLDPAQSDAYGNLAWMLATASDAKIRDPARALELAQKAVELTSFEDADKLDTLAAALAANGKFPDAVSRQEEALKFPDFEKEQGRAARGRLELYRQGKPYVQSR